MQDLEVSVGRIAEQDNCQGQFGEELDLFLADARTGKILRKLSSKAKSGHIDEYNFIESAGAWSPDSKKIAFVSNSGL